MQMQSEKIEKIQHDYEKLKIKADFLAERLEELREENFRLHSIISSLKDEIQVCYFFFNFSIFLVKGRKKNNLQIKRNECDVNEGK